MNVLIVDDSATNRKLLRAVLEAEGITVYHAEDGQKALDLLEREEVDAIISDILMPNVDGYRLCYEVRKNQRFQHLPFIIYTSTYTSPSDEKLSMDLGADQFIRKPASSERLKQALQEVLHRSGRPAPIEPPAELRLMKEYTARLVSKLEEKNLELSQRMAELGATQNQLAHVLAHVPVVIYRLKINALDVTPTLVSENIERLLGHNVQEAMSYAWWREHLHPDDQARMQQVLAGLLRGEGYKVEYRLRHKDGTYRWVEDNNRVLLDAAGRPSECVGVWTDVTERKQSQSREQLLHTELRGKTAFLEAQINSTLDGILVVDSKGRTILENQQTMQLWKIPPEIAADKNDARRLEFVKARVKNPQRFIEKVAHLYAHPNEVSHDEIELVDGTILDRYSSPVLDHQGTYYGRIWLFRDATERRKLESQLRQSQKMEAVGQLAGGVAHDFNNLLAVIRGNADLVLMDNGHLGGDARDCLNQVVAASERAANLTQQLLIFSRKQLMQSQVLQLHELVKNLTKMLRRVIPENIDLKCATLEQPSWVKADAGMLEQVLLNLVVNARDAMPKGGELVVSIQKMSIGRDYLKSRPEARVGDFVGLEVSDTGMGIAPENLPRIFEPFFTTKQPGKGTGLGLATVFGIVKQHKGWLEVESRVGEGSSFKIFLPAVPPPDKVASATQPEAELRGGTETILLVEDDFAVRMITRQVLETFQYKVYEATNGRDALKVWEQHSGEIALLLTDIVMPEGLTGRDLARQLRAQKPLLKVIFMSGYSPEALGRQTEFFHRTRSQFLRKPFSTQLLVRMLRQTLDESADG